MPASILAGAAAGAAGTVALNIATYVDMAVRGRASSSIPAQLIGVITDRLGVTLAAGESDRAKQQAQHRRSGLGDVPIGLSGVSDPASWAPADWAADLIPHCIYGLVTAGVYEAFAR